MGLRRLKNCALRKSFVRDKTIASERGSRDNVFMRLRFWFVTSIVLNLGLLAAWYIAHIQEVQNPFIRAPRPDLAPRTNRIIVPTVRYVNITWGQIESTNLAAYIANLQAVGCPAGTIRDIVLAQVNQSFARRRATEVLTPDQQWWKTEPDAAATRSANTQLRLLESARRSLLNSLLGPTWETETDVSAWIESNYGLTGPHLGTLPPEAKQALYDLAARTQETAAGQNSADTVRAYQSERAGLRAWLTPVALNEYLLRYSPSGAQLRADTRGVNYSPEQFQALFAAIDPIVIQPEFYYRGNDPGLAASQRALQAQYDDALQQALGADTYRSLRLNQDPLYTSTTAAAQQADIPAKAVMQLYEISRATQAELNRIRNDATLSYDDKITALDNTRTEEQKAVQQLLGPVAFKNWLKTRSLP
jgi:hypothetical protein